ncbi:hypothetical protein [Streptomyces goshikiensis]|uniref:hypothetical protein n=1 Tax=Streptomyces goshikiensis TaxID=1942 RepID=UPI0036AC3BA7
MTAPAPLYLRADAVVLLRSLGWRGGLEDRALERAGLRWTVTSPAGDSRLSTTGEEVGEDVAFDSRTPAAVIAQTCRAAAGDPPAAPVARTAALSDALAAALAERTVEGLAADADYDSAVFDVVRAITALAGDAPGPVTG